MSDIHISIVTPVYGSYESLTPLYERLEKTLSQITNKFEIIMVNDASPDDSWQIIKELAHNDSRVKGINFSRNFGQHHAITAGLDYAKGDWVVVMDCDLQDQPEEIIKFYNKAQEGYDIVVGKRTERQDSFFKKLSSKLYYRVLTYLTDTDFDDTIANFGIYSNKVITSIKMYREKSRLFGIFAVSVGFNRIHIPIEHAARTHGDSSYTLKKLIRLAADTMVTYSNKPLHLSIKIGFMISFFSSFYGIFLIARYMLYSVSVAGWTSLMVAMFFMFGLLFAQLGIMGVYIGKIFDEVKYRPLYIVDELLNLNPNSLE